MKKGKGLQTLLFVGVTLLLATTDASAASKKDEKSHYPDATRSEPKSDLSNAADQKSLQQGLDALNSGDDAKAQELLQKVLDSSKSKYAQGIAEVGCVSVLISKAEESHLFTGKVYLLHFGNILFPIALQLAIVPSGHAKYKQVILSHIVLLLLINFKQIYLAGTNFCFN